MSSILVFCRDCGKQVSSAEARDQLCVDCRVRRSVSDLRDEHVRLNGLGDEVEPRASPTSWGFVVGEDRLASSWVLEQPNAGGEPPRHE